MVFTLYHQLYNKIISYGQTFRNTEQGAREAISSVFKSRLNLIN